MNIKAIIKRNAFTLLIWMAGTAGIVTPLAVGYDISTWMPALGVCFVILVAIIFIGES